ncbi:MAG TPA: alpha/beta fold hydrolase [Thermoplasmata archaeon]|nr:alpha/beta fold hydrolase [Thermoplasmata archaeon]
MTEPAPTKFSLFHLDRGEGPAILLLHGLGGDHTIWAPMLPGLSGEFRSIAPDLRGHGRTPAPVGSTLSFAEFEGDLEHLLASGGVERAHIVGFSAGALLALQFALDHPERVASLVSIAGAVNVDNHTRAILDRWSETYQKEGFEAYVLRLAKDLYYPDWIEAHLEVLDRLREQAADQEYGGMMRWREAIRRFDLRGRIGKIRAPTLVIHAMDDQVMDVAHARLLRQSIPGAELRLLSQVGHMIPVERPSETERTLLEWVRKVEANRPTAGPASAR